MSELFGEIFKRHPERKEGGGLELLPHSQLQSTSDRCQLTAHEKTTPRRMTPRYRMRADFLCNSTPAFDGSYQNSPSLRTRMLSNSLSRSERESHSQERSDQGPPHSPRPHGLRSRTRGVSPLALRTRANPVTL